MSDKHNYHPEAIDARQRLSRLNPLVYEAVETGIETALEIEENHFRTDEPRDPWHFSHTVRRKAVEILQHDRNSEAQFKVHKNPMSGVEIECAGFSLRIWKKHVDEFLQPPGESPRRQGFASGVVQTRIREFSHLMRPTKNLVYVWEPVSGGGLELWLVSPNGFDEIWKPANSEWIIDIPHPAASMEPEVDFAKEDEDLPIRPEEVGEGGDDDAS